MCSVSHLSGLCLNDKIAVDFDKPLMLNRIINIRKNEVIATLYLDEFPNRGTQ